jgi:hypothetical protein
MFTNADEAAYCTMRIARSTALARTSEDSCARASHAGIAAEYQLRLSTLVRTGNVSVLPAALPTPVARETEAACRPTSGRRPSERARARTREAETKSRP